MSQCQRSTPHGRFLVAFAVIVPMFLAIHPAFAANRQAQENAASKACLTGDYTKGVAILSELFVETKEPTYIYNQGRCFEQNRRYEEALARFEEFLATSENIRQKPEDEEEAQKHIASCKKLLAEQNAKAAATAQVLAAPPPPSPVPQTPVQPTVVVEQEKHQPAAEEGKGLLVGGIITASLGAAAVGLGVFLNVKANRMVNDMETKVGDYSSGKDSDRKTYKALSWVGYSVGAASLATGAILIGLWAWGGGGGSSDLALVPALGDGQAGLVLTGGF